MIEFQLSYFKSWKMMLWKCCTQYASKFGKLSSGHRTGKGQFSRKALAKNAQTTTQLHSSHTLVKVMLKILQARLQQYLNFQMFKLDLEKEEELEVKLPTSIGSSKKNKEVPEKHVLLLYWLCQSLWLCRSQHTVENSSRDGNTRPRDLPHEKSACRPRSNS